MLVANNEIAFKSLSLWRGWHGAKILAKVWPGAKILAKVWLGWPAAGTRAPVEPAQPDAASGFEFS